MEFVRVLMMLLELAGMTIAGYFVGKLTHLLLMAVFGRIAKHTKTKLDDFVLEEIDRPLEVISVFLVIYLLSNGVQIFADLRNVVSKYALSAIVLIASYTVAEIIGAVLKWYYVEGKEKTRLKHVRFDVSLLPFIRKTSKIIIVLLGATFALSVLGIDVTGVFAIAGFLGIIIGLASQETLGNVFAGIALQADRPFLYGEYLKFATGEVAQLIKIGLRSTKLEDLNGNIIMISNSELAKQKITNLSRPTDEFGSTIQVEVPKKTDVNRFDSFMKREVARSKTEGLKKEAISLYIDKVSSTGILISIGFGVTAHPHLARARDFFNRKTLEFLRKEKLL